MQSIFIEIAIGIILCVAYFVFIILKSRKFPKYLGAMLWGLLAFGVGKAISNMLNLGFIYLFNKGILPTNGVLVLGATGLTTAVGMVFSAFFIFNTLKKRDAFQANSTGIVLGLMSGSGFIASPVNNNSVMMKLIQMLVNTMVINKNPTQEELGDIPLAEIEKIRDSLLNSQTGQFLMFAIYGIALAILTYLLYRVVEKHLEEETAFSKYGIPFLIGLLMFSLLELTQLVTFSAMLVNALMVLVTVGSIYGVHRYLNTEKHG